MKKSRFFGLVLVTIVALFISVNNVNASQLDDYLIVANANASITSTFVYGDYFYVVNDTDILKYYLEDGTLTDSYQIIDFMDSVRIVLRKGYEVYIDMTYGGTRYFMCFDLRTFTELNRTAYTNIDEMSIVNEVWNYVYYEFDNHGYWIYAYGNLSDGGSYAHAHANVFKMSFDEIEPYENFGVVAMTHLDTGNFFGNPMVHIYVYNTTSDTTTRYEQDCGASTDHKSQFSYLGLIYNVSGSEWIKSALFGETTPSPEYDQNDWAGYEDNYNMQSEIVIQDSGEMFTYATWGRFTIRGDLNIEIIGEFFPDVRDHAWYWDLDSNTDYVWAYSHNWGDTPDTKFRRAQNKEGVGFVAWVDYDTVYPPDFRNNILKIGKVGLGEYETYTGFDNVYIGYVNYTNLIPIAERTVGASGNDIVSSFDYDNLEDCRIYNADENLIAFFTIENDPDLYILRNLIDREELASGGYTTPTLAFVDAYLYTVTGAGDRVISDGWLFMGEVYELESTIQNMTHYYMQLNDGQNTVRFYYINETKSLNVTANNLVIGLVAGNVELINATSEQYQCIWRFILNKNIVDATNITITYYGANIPELKTVSGTAITGLNIYNLGGYASYSFVGDGGRTVGGDTFELYATDGNQSSSAIAYVIFRKLQHMHLLVEIDMDNDFDTNHLDFPLGCGFIEYGFDYRLDGAWVTGWKAKIYVNDARVGRYGAGTDASWVELEIDWYNKAHQAGVIKDDYIYAYHYGYDKDADYANRKSVMVWIDLWFNKMNSSTVIGGRVNGYEYGMYEAGSTWWFGYGNFRPKIGNETASMFFDDLYDGDGDITNCQPFELIRAYAKVEKINSTDGNDDTWRLKNYEILNWKLAEDRMEGVDTPVFVETKDPSMPKTGFVSPIVMAIQAISTAIWKGAFGFIKIFISAIDSILLWLNSPVSMSQMIEWVMIQSSYIAGWINTVIQYTSTILGVFTRMITTLLQITGYMTNAILWVLIYVVGFPLHFLMVIVSAFQGGSYTIGEFTFDFTQVGELTASIAQFAPYTIGFFFIAWLIWGNIHMEGDIHVEGIPMRMISIFRWFREVYQDIYWIFNAMQNKVIELYNFIRSHIPSLGGSGGTTAE